MTDAHPYGGGHTKNRQGSVLTEAVTIPDTAAIRRDLEYMTARWSELPVPARFEIRAFKENAHPQTAMFDMERMDEAVEWAADMNGMGYNVYAVRNPIKHTVVGNAKDSDILAAFFLWADCDDPAAADNVSRFDGPRCSAAVLTGTTPSTRVHIYWQLEKPCLDMDEWREMQCTIAAHFGSDRSVVNPSRIMRIAGTVAYPDRKKRERGYIKEVATLRTEYADDRPAVTLDQMRRVFSARQPAAPAVKALTVDTGAFETLDRERAAIAAMSGQEWHNSVIRLVASYVAKGLSDGEIHALTDPLTLSGYTVEETRREVQVAIDGARRKGWTPEQTYANPAAIAAPPIGAPVENGDGASFDAPKRPLDLEWFDDVEPALVDSYLIKGFLASGAMSVIYGPSNSGKTFFALDIAFNLSIGQAWNGRRVKPSAVLYLAAEGGRGVLNRIAALKSEYGVTDVPMAIKRAGLDLLHEQADLQHIVDLTAVVADRTPGKPLLIVIDTLSRIMAGGDENSAADMTALIRNIDAIREATGAHIMLVHHTGKDAARGARGHSSLRAATDTEIEVANEDGARAAMVTKQRDYQGGETFAFALKSVSLGLDQDGDEVTSCVVETADAEEFQAARKAKKGLGANQQKLLDTFDQMIADGLGKPNPGGVGMPDPGRFMTVSLDDLRGAFMGKIAASNKRGAFLEAFNALSSERGVLCMASEIVWRVDRRI